MAAQADRSHYQVLGVAERATLEEIRRAHRQLARVLHPDRLNGASDAERNLAERRMREVNAAWTVLSDSDRRRDYDRVLVNARVSAASGGTGGARSAGGAGGAAAGGAGAGAGGSGAGGAGATGYRPWEFDAGVGRRDEVDPDEEPLPNWHFWLLRRGPIAAALVLAVGIFIFTAYAGSGGDGGSVRTTLAAQDCVRVTSGRSAVTTSCDGPNNGRIVTAVDTPLDCPSGTRYVILGSDVHCVDGDAGQPDGVDGVTVPPGG